MRVRGTLTIFCAALIYLSAAGVRPLGEEQSNKPDAASKSVLSGEPDRSPDSSLQRTEDRGGTLYSPNGKSSVTAPRESPQQGIANSNKATCLIGMEVRNQQNDKLGYIKDVVMDLSSGRVSYVVLSTGGFLGFGDRLIAIPPNAIQAPLEGDYVMISADKQRIMAAPSFARTNWPDPLSPNVEAYWASDREGVGGTSAGVSVGSASGISTDYPADTGRQLRTESRYSSDRSSAENHIFKGKITAINLEARTMVVEGEGGSHVFTLTDRPTLTVKSNRNPHLIDFKVGYSVSVGYREEGQGNYIAHSVIRRNASEVK